MELYIALTLQIWAQNKFLFCDSMFIEKYKYWPGKDKYIKAEKL